MRSRKVASEVSEIKRIGKGASSSAKRQRGYSAAREFLNKRIFGKRDGQSKRLVFDFGGRTISLPELIESNIEPDGDGKLTYGSSRKITRVDSIIPFSDARDGFLVFGKVGAGKEADFELVLLEKSDVQWVCVALSHGYLPSGDIHARGGIFIAKKFHRKKLGTALHFLKLLELAKQGVRSYKYIAAGDEKHRQKSVAFARGSGIKLTGVSSKTGVQRIPRLTE